MAQCAFPISGAEVRGRAYPAEDFRSVGQRGNREQSKQRHRSDNYPAPRRARRLRLQSC